MIITFPSETKGCASERDEKKVRLANDGGGGGEEGAEVENGKQKENKKRQDRNDGKLANRCGAVNAPGNSDKRLRRWKIAQINDVKKHFPLNFCNKEKLCSYCFKWQH